MRTAFAEDILQRFLRYAAIDTMSDDTLVATRSPSTDGQWDLLNLLVAELKEMGISDIHVDGHGVVIARIASNLDYEVPTIGFMAHVDTADDVPGNGVKCRVIESYDGSDIPLNKEHTIRVSDNDQLAQYKGGTLIVTDGTTLLGSDDKAGVAAIMAVAKALCSDPSSKHGPLELIFTSDEETGAGMDTFPYDKIGCDYCYTIDGGKRFEIESECFNAATVNVHFSGVSYHLGAARGRLVNALTMAAFFINALPQAESPEATDGRYGYYCAHTISGTATEVSLTVYLRDFDLEILNHRIDALKLLAKSAEALYPKGKVSVEAKHVYYNMAMVSQEKPIAMDNLREAGRRLGMELEEALIRGGTDGARMANEHKIPCPNIFTGGHNLHSRFEWAALSAMEDSASLVREIIKVGSEK
ncbi:MAG: peptidase T [Spirochaetia bacterium]|jgi:tripeptide aminopeptidase|nr:peptidase T [Spirochaetia bacterium]